MDTLEQLMGLEIEHLETLATVPTLEFLLTTYVIPIEISNFHTGSSLSVLKHPSCQQDEGTDPFSFCAVCRRKLQAFIRSWVWSQW